MNFRIPKEPLLPQKQSVGVRSLSPSPSPPPQSRWRLVFLLFPFFVFSIFIYGSSHLKRSFSSTLLSSPRHQPPIIPPWHLIEPSSESSHLLFPPSPAIPCPSLNSLDISTRYNYIKNTSGRTLLALNLYNSEHVLPSLSRLILELAEFLGKEKIAVVVFENGSKDSTKTLLGNLRRKLEQVEVRNLIWSSVYSTDWTRVDRIEQLAVFRNIVTSPLRSSFPNFPAPNEFETVLFLNDVFACSIDALELMHQRQFQEASATCGLDWMRKSWPVRSRGGNVVFYDNWVTRSLTGRTLRPQLDLLRHWKDGVSALFLDPGEEKYRKRYEQGLPLPVYSCWNGMAAFDARPFRGVSLSRGGDLEQQPLLFRSGEEEVKGECSASECKLIAKDFWRRGFNRFVLVPTVRSTYESSLYTEPSLVSLAARRSPSSHEGERIMWSEVKGPKSVECWSWHRTLRWDFWFMAQWKKPI